MLFSASGSFFTNRPGASNASGSYGAHDGRSSMVKQRLNFFACNMYSRNSAKVLSTQLRIIVFSRIAVRDPLISRESVPLKTDLVDGFATEGKMTS
jgi:hypothetical protein